MLLKIVIVSSPNYYSTAFIVPAIRISSTEATPGLVPGVNCKCPDYTVA